MLVYVAHNGNQDKLRVIEKHPRLGLTFTPTDWRRGWKGKYFLDNGVYGAHVHEQPFDALALQEVIPRLPNADFVVLPDKIGQGWESLKFSIRWLNVLEHFGCKFYVAVQDGMTPRKFPETIIPRIAGIFVGGTWEWKKATYKEWIEYAHSKGLKCHIGRFGTLEYLMQAERDGADSVDSSNPARHMKNWYELLEFLNGVHKPLAHFITIEE